MSIKYFFINVILLLALCYTLNSLFPEILSYTLISDGDFSIVENSNLRAPEEMNIGI